MSVLKRSAFIAVLSGAVIFGLSACGESDSNADNAEKLRGAVKDVASKAKSTADTAVDHVEDKIKAPSPGTDSE